MKIFNFLAVTLFSMSLFALNVGDQAPQISGLKHQTPSAEQIVADLTSPGKVTVLEFFATTCSACTENLPFISQIQSELSDKADFKLVGIDRNESLVTNYIQKYSDMQKFQVVFDSQRQASKAYALKYTPTTFVISEEGKVLFKYIGVFEPETMDQLRQVLR